MLLLLKLYLIMSLPTGSFHHIGVHYLNAVSKTCLRMTGNKYSVVSINSFHVTGDVQVRVSESVRLEGDETWRSSGTLRNGKR